MTEVLIVGGLVFVALGVWWWRSDQKVRERLLMVLPRNHKGITTMELREKHGFGSSVYRHLSDLEYEGIAGARLGPTGEPWGHLRKFYWRKI